MLSWVDTELAVARVAPDPLHIAPVGDDTALNWVPHGEDSGPLTSHMTDIGVIVLATSDRIGVLDVADDGWEDGPWGLTTSETGLHHTGTIVDNKSLNFVRHRKVSAKADTKH